MLTEIGKYLRKARIDRGLLLKDMAEGIGVSSAHLSTIETGKRHVTPDLISRLAVFLGLKPNDAGWAELDRAAALSRGQVEIHTRGLSMKHQEAALAFSRQFKEMESTDLDKLLKMLNSAQKKR